jgi:hypothetical protein
MHLIVSIDDFDIEVQIRTWFQDAWANSTEQLGDVWGRWLRYGLPAEGPTEAMRRARQEVVRLNLDYANATAALETVYARGMVRTPGFDFNVHKEDVALTEQRFDLALDRFADARDRTLSM